MTLQEQLKTVILAQNKNLRTFCTKENIPHSTIRNILERPNGIGNSGVDTILKICNALNLDVESIPTGTLRYKDLHYQETLEIIEKDLIEMYKLLNDEGKKRIRADLEILVESPKYSIDRSGRDE